MQLMENRMDGATFYRLVKGGAAQLRANASIVNDLNVFPIPDGDTGENMSLTIGGGIKHAGECEACPLGEVARKIADGMLLSARGNSGVILSRLFAGIAEAFDGMEDASVSETVTAMKNGVKSAYEAVLHPTEGTILTVAREATDRAAQLEEGSSFSALGKVCMDEVDASLKRTPELLPVLKEAGVVDSGGAGLYYILDGMIRTARGETLDASGMTAGSAAQNDVDFSKFTENSVMEYGYCTEFLLQLQTSKVDVETFSVDTLTEYLRTVGDSIVAFRNGSIIKVHVHTMHPGEVLDHCQQFGEFLTLKIENMTLQHHETVIENRFSVEKTQEKKEFGIVTVATGEGIVNTFRDLGADYVIDGGQGHNPSTEDFVNAFEAVAADTIFVLPNNGNIVMAAKQAAEIYEKSRVIVVESKNLGEGYAALTMFSDESHDADVVAEGLREAMQGVVTGLVTRAVRSAKINDVDIHENNFVGFTDKTMQVSEHTAVDTACALLGKLDASRYDILIAIYGVDVSAAEREAFRGQCSAAFPGMELYEIDGEQQVFDFILILQ